MTSAIIENSVRWILVLAIQVLVLNNVHLGGVFNPLMYVIVVLSLPLELSGVAVLLVGFFSGLFVDVFSHTMGLHTMALTFLAYLRPFVLRFIAPRDGFDFGTKPSMYDFGFGRYLIYVAILVFAHHFLLFFLEGFGSGIGWLTIQRIFLNTVLTLLLVFLFQSFRKKGN